MEIGEEGVDNLEFESGKDEEACGAASGGNRAVLVSEVFEDADDGGADGDDSAALFPCAPDAVYGLGGNLIFLFVHGMKGGVLLFDREKGTGADVKGDGDAFNAAGLKVGKKIGGEVQSSGRGGDGSGLACVDGLVAFAVLGCGERVVPGIGKMSFLPAPEDVGWEGSLSDGVEDFVPGRAAPVELEDAGAGALAEPGDCGLETVGIEDDPVAGTDPFPGAYESLPACGLRRGGFSRVAGGGWRLRADEERFDASASRRAASKETGGDDAAFVEDEDVAGTQEVR